MHLTHDRANTAPISLVPARSTVGPSPAPPPAEAAVGSVGSTNLAFFSLALGVAGALLGVTVIWFFAAIPLGLAAVVTGALALRSRHLGPHRSRAVLGTVLGTVALLLGVLSAILVPAVARELDAAVTRVRDDVTGQIDRVDRSIAGDVDRVNATVTGEMREFERQNRRALREFEGSSAAELRRLEQRLAASESKLPAQQRIDLDRLARELRRELATVDGNMRGVDTSTQAMLAAMVSRIEALEQRLGLAVPAAGAASPPVASATGG